MNARKLIKDFLECTKDYPSEIGITMETLGTDMVMGITVTLEGLRDIFRDELTDFRVSGKGKASVERLWHFQCWHCQKWWSIGDAPQNRSVWTCPWCSRLGIFEDE